MLSVWLTLMLLSLANIGAGYEEKDFNCQSADLRIPTTSICDGILDCADASDNASGRDLSDESENICAPASYLTEDFGLDVDEVTNTSLVLLWYGATEKISNYSLELAGCFVTGKSEGHSFQNTVSRRLFEYKVQWLKPWTRYTLIVRPFYTETGKPQSSYKIGRAASVAVMTLASAPEVPGLVSVLSARQRNVVLNIVGPSFWNSDAVAFRVRWEPTSHGRDLHGELVVSLDADWSPQENTINATLPLQGGWDYRVFVSAIGRGASETRLEGPELEVEVNVPLDSYELSVYGIDSSSAVLSWRSSQPADVFKVTVMKVSSEGITFNSHNYTFDGTQKKMTSRHTVAVSGLEPWSYYVAILEGCSADDCSESVNTTFATPPYGVTLPEVTRVESTSPDSFEISWRFAQTDSRLYEGFRVQYCNGSYDDGTCFVAHTKEKSFRVQELEPSPTYYIGVSAVYRNSQGELWLGPPARASIETWSRVPLVTVRHHGNIDDGFSTSVFAWTCVSSNVSYLQYRLDGRGEWATCDDSDECDVTVEHPRTAARTSGYLRLTHHRRNQNFALGIRGCNIDGCGLEKMVHLSVQDKASLPPAVATVTWQRDGAHLKCDELPYNRDQGFEILWKCGTDVDMHRKQSLRGRTQLFNNQEALCTTQIYGIPEEATDCNVSVAKYKQSGERTYYGPRVQVPLA